jgi:HPt (histidine-containing phosphotransfer) domain-containing protein
LHLLQCFPLFRESLSDAARVPVVKCLALLHAGDARMRAAAPEWSAPMINHDLVATMATSTGLTREAVLDAFRSSTRSDMAQLRALVAAGAHAQAAAQAHRLTGACEMLGAAAAAQASRALEAAARDAPESIASQLARLEREMQQLDAVLGAPHGR